MLIACIGVGAPILNAVGMWRGRGVFERSALAFAIGFGVLGWIVFWFALSGNLIADWLWGLLALMSLGNYLHRLPSAERQSDKIDGITWALVVLIAAAVFLDVLEGFAPPVDADSLAYHFELARRLAEDERLMFIPWAFSGAIPLLVHMTYTTAYALGGELALTLWTFATAHMGIVLFFTLLRRWLPVNWALVLALLCLTTPAMIYSGGAGHAEPRITLFTLTAAFGLIEAHLTRRLAPIVLVGLGAGFFAATKYTGLLFVIAAGIGVLATRGAWFRGGILFSGVCALVGLQWYGWNFVHTGDPVFPLLFTWADKFGLANHLYWTADHAAFLKTYLEGRSDPVEGWHWIVTFPVIATLFPLADFEAGRVGLGPFALLVMPMALWAAWSGRRRIVGSALFPVAVMVFVFYFLWMELGGIPKVRHLLPIYPLLLACIAVAAIGAGRPSFLRPIALAGAASLSVNFAALSLFSIAYVQYHFSAMTRDQFLTRMIPGYMATKLVNSTDGVDYLVIWDRQLRYYVRPRTFFASGNNQIMVDMRPGFVEPRKLYRELRERKISHLLLRAFSDSDAPNDLNDAAHKLSSAGCLEKIDEQPFMLFASRTIRSLEYAQTSLVLWKVVEGCHVD